MGLSDETRYKRSALLSQVNTSGNIQALRAASIAMRECLEELDARLSEEHANATCYTAVGGAGIVMARLQHHRRHCESGFVDQTCNVRLMRCLLRGDGSTDGAEEGALLIRAENMLRRDRTQRAPAYRRP